MGRKNRNKHRQQQHQNNRPQNHGGTAMQSRPNQSNPQRPAAADADIALSIASLGDRIDHLKARWAQTQTKIETLRQASREVLAEHHLAMDLAVEVDASVQTSDVTDADSAAEETDVSTDAEINAEATAQSGDEVLTDKA